MKKTSEKILWSLLKDGDLKAYGVLFKKYYTSLYNYGLKISGNKVITEDSIQEFFMYLYEHRENLSDLNVIAPYLFTSYRRFIIKILQKKQKIHMVRDINENIVDIQSSPEELLTNKEFNDFKNKNLHILLNKLPNRQREVLYLKYNCELKTQDISEIMGINYQSVVNNIHKAIKGLREEIKILQLFNS
ncbi:RNA polymerase sigma factor [Tenacibaculum aestuariivivum]|uniref:RNA polymerase sigma factor n=1 Tax=Tenacibaculum aestuariivivum TaxID=2006131 RepID=UPI003AB38187